MWPSDHKLFHMNLPFQATLLQFIDALENEDHFLYNKTFSQADEGERFKANLNGIFSWSAMTVLL